MECSDYAKIAPLVEYDPNTGILTRKAVGRFASPRYIGKPTGWLHASGYIFTTILGRKRKAHRVAWLLMTGEWPPSEIDHINGDRADNRWDNLRLATRGENCRNTGIPKDNTSGIKGVGFVAKRGKWRANIGFNNKLIFLGHFMTAEEARAAYEAAAIKYFGEYARKA